MTSLDDSMPELAAMLRPAESSPGSRGSAGSAVSAEWSTDTADSRSTAAATAEALVASRRDPDRFAEVFDRHYAEIYGYIARRLGRDLAEDLASETFAIAFRKRAGFDEAQGDGRAWLYGIASNLIRREHRRETRAYRAMRRLPRERDSAGHEDGVVARVTAESAGLAGALAKLSKGDREVLLLVALAGLTYEEVAAALGIAYGTVCSRLSRARRKLRAGLGAGLGPPGADGVGEVDRFEKSNVEGRGFLPYGKNRRGGPEEVSRNHG